MNGMYNKVVKFTSYPVILSLLFAAGLSTWVLIVWFPPLFASVTGGMKAFDLQPGFRLMGDNADLLTVDLIFANLQAWPEVAFSLYELFIVIDMLLPVSVFMAMLLLNFRWSQRLRPKLIERIWPVFLVPAIPMLVDVGENVGFLLVVNAWPDVKFYAAAKFAVAFHSIKMLTVAVANFVLFAMAIVCFLPGFGFLRKQQGGQA